MGRNKSLNASVLSANATIGHELDSYYITLRASVISSTNKSTTKEEEKVQEQQLEALLDHAVSLQLNMGRSLTSTPYLKILCKSGRMLSST